jgi:hypothetical protein
LRRWIAAEETIYEDPLDPMVNWHRDDLAGAANEAGLKVEHLNSEQTVTEFLVTDGVLSRWFPEESDVQKTKGKPSYAKRLALFLSLDEVDRIRRYISLKLAGKQISWKSESIHLVAHLK